MSDVFDELPVVYGVYVPTGELRHVDEVENGKACDCICPDPRCGQRLIAKNGGERVIHHFAHERGSCTWAVEYLISLLAAEAVRSRGRITFPALYYDDALKRGEVLHADALTIPITDVELVEVSGRHAPDLILTWRSKSGEQRKFALVFQLNHGVTGEQVSRLASVTEGVVLVDLRAHMRRALRARDRHADRNALVMSYQNAAFIAGVLSDPKGGILRWAYNATADCLHAQSVVRKQEADEERRIQREQEERERWERAERLRAEREEAERVARAKREAREAELAKERELAEKRRAEWERQEEEEARREEAMRPEHDGEYLAEMSPLVEQQEVPARDKWGRRWVKCKVCGKVAPEREFATFGGKGSLNAGTCTECMRRL